MAAALPALTTTVGEQQSDYDNRYTGYTGPLAIQVIPYQQASRDLLDQGALFLTNTWPTLITVPDAAKKFLDKQQLAVIGNGWLTHCDRSIRGLCKLPLAAQIQELQGSTGRYPGPHWLSASRQLSEDEAYKMLRQTAMNQGRRLVDVAKTVLAMSDYL